MKAPLRLWFLVVALAVVPAVGVVGAQTFPAPVGRVNDSPVWPAP